MLSFCRADSLFVEQLLDKNLVDRKPVLVLVFAHGPSPLGALMC